MKSKLLVSLLLLSLLTSALALTAHTQLANASNENVHLFINPPEIDKTPSNVNSFFDVYLRITDVTDLFGFDIKLTWTDNTLITIDFATSNATTTTILNDVWGAGNWMMVISDASGGGGGGGYFRIVALSTHIGFTGDHDLIDLHFQIMRSCNLVQKTPIQIAAVKLSDSHWTPIPATTTDGLFIMGATTPDIELILVNPQTSYEWGNTFDVEVYATHVTDLTDFDLTIVFNQELLKFVDVDYWGVFTGTFSNTIGSVEVSASGAAHTGDNVLLFALTFQVKFNDDITHIWRTKAPQDLTDTVSIRNDVGDLSFTEGPVPITSITLPAPLTVTIHLIRGDVDCDGEVTVFDLRTVARFYDLSSPVKYDLNMDGTIDIFDLVIVATNIEIGGP